MYVCMYACMHVFMYACMHVCMYGCMDVWMYGCMHVWMYGCMDVCYVWLCMVMYGYELLWMDGYGWMFRSHRIWSYLIHPRHPQRYQGAMIKAQDTQVSSSSRLTSGALRWKIYRKTMAFPHEISRKPWFIQVKPMVSCIFPPIQG